MAKTKLEWYGAKLERQALSGATDGVNAVTREIAAAAPKFLTRGSGVDRGKLKRNIRATRAKRQGTRITGRAAPTKRAWYGRFLVAGAGPHTIKAAPGKYLVWKSKAIGYKLSDQWGHKIGYALPGTQLGAGVKAKSIYWTRKGKTTTARRRAAAVWAKEVTHPGIAANNFMQKALDQVWPKAPEIIARAGGQAMQR